MGKFKQIAEDEYEETRADGNTTKYKHENIGLTAELTDLRLLSSRSIDVKDEEKSEQWMVGSWKPEDYHFDIIGDEGAHDFCSPARIYVGKGEFKHSNFWHFPPKYGPEEVYFSFYLPPEWFDWLWNEMTTRPGAPVEFRFNAFLWLMGIEAHMYYESCYNSIRLVENSRSPISEIKITVGVKQPEKAEIEPPATWSEKLGKELEATDAGVWAKRIFWLLLIAAAYLIFRR